MVRRGQMLPKAKQLKFRARALAYICGMAKPMTWGWFWPDSWHLRPWIYVLVSIHTEVMSSVMNLTGQGSAAGQSGHKAKQKKPKHWNQRALELNLHFSLGKLPFLVLNVFIHEMGAIMLTLKGLYKDFRKQQVYSTYWVLIEVAIIHLISR